MATRCSHRPVVLDEDYRSMLPQALRQQEREQQILDLGERKQSLSPRELQTKWEQRNECARQILAMHYYFDSTSPAVFASSVRIMDTVLIKVNIPWKYISCFSAACFFIACKWIEDDYEPQVSVLTQLHYKQWKEVDLRRMEEKVLSVLGWQIPRCTYLSFLPGLMKVLSRCHTTTSLPPMTHVVMRAQRFLLNHFSFMFKPAALALAALEDSCRRSGVCSPSMSYTLMVLQDSVQVLDSEMYEISQLLLGGDTDSQPEAAPQCNKAYFPKVFDTPCDSFCPDYRLYDIPEERDDNASGLDLRLHAPATPLHSTNDSISDYDYSDDGSEESETSADVKDWRPTQCCSVKQTPSTERHQVPAHTSNPNVNLEGFSECKQSDSCPVTGLEEADQFSRPDPHCHHGNVELSPAELETTGGIPCSPTPESTPSGVCIKCLSSEDTASDRDSGCEQDSDEQDSSSEQDLSEQDSGLDQDSDS